jgi:hypothetical protein
MEKELQRGCGFQQGREPVPMHRADVEDFSMNIATIAVSRLLRL